MPLSNIFTWKRERRTTLGYRSVAFVFCLLWLKREEVAIVVHIINNHKKMGGFIRLSGSSRPRAHLSGLSRLTFLQPNYFFLVLFWSRPFLLPLLLSCLILSPFLLHSRNHLLPTVSFHSLSCFPNSTAHHYYVIPHLHLGQIVIHRKKIHMDWKSKKGKKNQNNQNTLHCWAILACRNTWHE